MMRPNDGCRGDYIVAPVLSGVYKMEFLYTVHFHFLVVDKWREEMKTLIRRCCLLYLSMSHIILAI